MDEALVEHAGAKELIAQLQAAHPDDDLYDAKVTVLGEQIEHHVQEEEGSMFPQARASGIDTLSLGAAMLRRKAEVLANANTPLVRTSVNDDGGDVQEEQPPKKNRNRQSPLARPETHRRPAKIASKTGRGSRAWT